VEQALQDVVTTFAQLQKDREKADYDGGWRLVETDVRNAIRLAEDVFARWRQIKGEDIARYHLLAMFGARSD
jgi:head-tail adaptor